MTPEEATFKGVVYGAAIALVGTALTSIVQVVLQTMQVKAAVKAERQKEFDRKQMNAIQGVVQMCDFLISFNGKRLRFNDQPPSGGHEWFRIRGENLASGALIPPALQDEFQSIMTPALRLEEAITVSDLRERGWQGARNVLHDSRIGSRRGDRVDVSRLWQSLG